MAQYKKKGINDYLFLIIIKNKMSKLKKIQTDIEKMRRGINKYFELGDYETVIKYLEFFGSFMFQVNAEYVDHEIEELISKISKKILCDMSLKQEEKRILFYDGFGFDMRGLAYIYIKALIELGFHVVYVVPENRKKSIPIITDMLKKADCDIYFISLDNRLEAVKWLLDMIKASSISKMILYIQPNDIVPILASTIIEGKIKRFLINLTDHAFWIGKNAADCFIEFREYGCYLSWVGRKIEKEKIKWLPYYPIVDYKADFAGFPFDREGKKIIFSGGSLYKTIDSEMKYYLMVEKILEKNADAIFLYAGDGDGRGLKGLKRKFPERIYWIAERQDLYQVMQNSDLYLSTFPMAGGLMTQYAVVAGLVPLTLIHDDCGKGFLLHPEKINCEFYEMDKLVDYASEILDKRIRIKDTDNQIISSDVFRNQLYNILENEDSEFKYDFHYIDINSFRETYMERMNICNYLELWPNPKYMFIIKHFPIEFLAGVIIKVIKKMKK